MVPFNGHQAFFLIAGMELSLPIAFDPLNPFWLKLIQIGTADQLTFGKIMAAAVQTAGRFRPGLGLGEAEIDLLKVVLPAPPGDGWASWPGAA